MQHDCLRNALILALLSLASPLHAAQYLIQEGEDSSPYAFLPDLPRGFHNTAYAFTNDLDGTDHSFEYYIRFDLPPALEPGTVVEQAWVWIYYGFDFVVFGDSTGEVGEIECREVLESWSESSLTWNNRPLLGPVFDGWENVTERGMYWCEVTDLVQDWIDGAAPNDGIAITSDELRVIGFWTFDDGTMSPNFKPSLFVETLPEPSTAAGLLAGCGLLGVCARLRGRPSTR